MKAALHGGELYTALSEDDVGSNKNEKALVLITLASGNNSLKKIQECESVKAVWDKLNSRYAGRRVLSKIGTFNSSLNTKLKSNSYKGRHISILDSQYIRLNAMGVEVEEQLKIAILIGSYPNRNEYSELIALLSTLQEEMARWPYVTMVLNKKEEQLLSTARSSVSKPSGEQKKIALLRKKEMWEVKMTK